MLDTDASFDERATIPYDLREYAVQHTGPASWSAHPDAEALSAWALEGHDDPLRARTTELLACVSPDDVPRLTLPAERVAAVVTHREAFVLASIDGGSTLEHLVDTLLLPIDERGGAERGVTLGEALEIVCRLCARGIVTLDRT